MPLDERIHELCNRLATTSDPDEACELAGLLRAALRAKTESLINGVADVIRGTHYGTLLGLTPPQPAYNQRKPPTTDYSAA
jgi:hypothetical protein